MRLGPAYQPDPRSAEIWLRRARGDTWISIGSDLGVSAQRAAGIVTGTPIGERSLRYVVLVLDRLRTAA